MVVDDTVSGFLDFEFCAYDWRAMELAVALSKYVGEAEPLPLIEEFVEGYCQFGRLPGHKVAVAMVSVTHPDSPHGSVFPPPFVQRPGMPSRSDAIFLDRMLVPSAHGNNYVILFVFSLKKNGAAECCNLKIAALKRQKWSKLQ